MYTGTMYSG